MRPALVPTVLTALALAFVHAAPAGAQYGGGPSLVVNPVRVPIDGEFDAFGSSCPAGSTVTVTIDGASGVLADTTAADDSFYIVRDVPMPGGVIAGFDYDVRATCGGQSASFLITAVCNDGSDPVGGACPDGRTTGSGSGTTATVTPGGGIPRPGGGLSDGGADTILAITGASLIEQLVTASATLVAAGFFLVSITARRRDRTRV